MKAMLYLLPGFSRWLAKIVASAILAAVMLAAMTYLVLSTNNPIKTEIRYQVKKAFKEELGNWLFCSQPNP